MVSDRTFLDILVVNILTHYSIKLQFSMFIKIIKLSTVNRPARFINFDSTQKLSLKKNLKIRIFSLSRYSKLNSDQ